MKRYIHRLHLSAYNKNDFSMREREAICSISNELNYLDTASGAPLILLSNTHVDFHEIPRDVVENTELLIHTNSGYDNIPLSFVENAKFPIVICNEIRRDAVCEYILSAVYSYYSKIEHQAAWDQSRKWNRPLLSKLNILIIKSAEREPAR